MKKTFNLAPAIPQDRPACAVNGVLHGGRAMCSAVIVGDKSCGHSRPCQHQVAATEASRAAKKVAS
ncbi:MULTISPECIES: hypothetical protein [unclassified Variovorax]|uniref:hypothetical protein n=1 Tax=unclassified Variovorax TaxID=663243 RepID=UPI00257726E0|nr:MULTISPECIES: hypothetical protein [unclassified Variovorax]MDM0086780.1 hypothetical protein [Variovorax sp. J22G40]MDM0144964.1 hypothetical protein [Variovorax sp. J2P1-31]